jgi:hypothetical protein
MLTAVFAGCAPKNETPTPPPASTPAGEETPDGNAGTGGVKTGLAVINSVAKSTDAGDKDGLAQTDSLVVAVTVDEGGKILACVIDAVQSKINFSKEGKLVTPLNTTFESKNELGEAYDMKKASGIGKEWNEQAAAFAAYVVGKTAAEVKGIAVNEEGVPTDADLVSSVTVHVTDFIAGVEKAAANAQALGASASDKLSLSTTTNMSKSADAGEKDGVAQAYSLYMALTTDASGVITSSVIDGSQCNVNFDKTGKITSDLKAAPQTKNELGEAYDMKKASSIGKEWNEQAAAFAKYITGKTPAEVAGIAVNEEGVATEADLLSSVTVHISDFLLLVEKAAK